MLVTGPRELRRSGVASIGAWALTIRVLCRRARRDRAVTLLILSVLTLTAAATPPVARTPATTALGVAAALRWLLALLALLSLSGLILLSRFLPRRALLL